jgi:hypothetical protein
MMMDRMLPWVNLPIGFSCKKSPHNSINTKSLGMG